MSTATPPLEPTSTAAGPARMGLVPMLIAVALSTVIAFAAVGGVGYWLLKSGRLASVAAAGAAVSAADRAKISAEQMSAELPPSHVLALDPMVVNLSDAGGRSYLRASISLRLADEVLAKGEKKKEEGGAKGDKADVGQSAALRDTTLAVLGEQASDTLLANGGLEALKKKLRETYAMQNREIHVLDVYVTDFLVQRG